MQSIQEEIQKRKQALAEKKAGTQSRFLKRAHLLQTEEDIPSSKRHDHETEKLADHNEEETTQFKSTVPSKEPEKRESESISKKTQCEATYLSFPYKKNPQEQMEKSKFTHDEDYVIHWIEFVLNAWGHCLAETGKTILTENNAKEYNLYTESYRNISPLLALLQERKISPSVLKITTDIANQAFKKEYVRANDFYMQLAIGNAPWPMGVTAVGIHERSASDRIQSNKVARKSFLTHVFYKLTLYVDVLNDESSRKYIQTIKRLLSVHQKIMPNSIRAKNI
jgi:pre-mRNA-splicing factor 18